MIWTVGQQAGVRSTVERVYRGATGLFLQMHDASGMMGQFVVIEPGTTPPDRIRLDGDGHRH